MSEQNTVKRLRENLSNICDVRVSPSIHDGNVSPWSLSFE